MARERSDMVNIDRTVMTWFSVRQRLKPRTETKSMIVSKNRQTEKAISMEASGSGITKKAKAWATHHRTQGLKCFKPRSNNRQTSSKHCN